ncbi:MAG: DHCW motif cupin fold protein [Pseudolysinimonas sp.]
MQLPDAPFGRVDWSQVEAVEHNGERGVALWRTQTLGTTRIRMVEYSPGYLADHWCTKGHVLLCLTGLLSTELGDGRLIELAPGDSYQVGDDSEPHRSSTTTGATLFIVD